METIDKTKAPTGVTLPVLNGPIYRQFGSDFRRGFVFFWKWWLRNKLGLGSGAIAVLLIAWFVIRPLEGDFNSAFRTGLADPRFRGLMDWLSWSGKELFPLLLLGLTLVTGFGLGKRRLQVAAVCLLIAYISSSLVTRAGKIGFGRLRPNMAEQYEMPDTFAGPTLKAAYHSFPSGHTSAAFSVALPVAFAVPAAAPPVFIWASGIALSRTYKNRHYLSDLWGGFFVGLGCSLPAYFLVRDVRRRERIPPQKVP